jgi:hypothetical protein
VLMSETQFTFQDYLESSSSVECEFVAEW